MKKLYTLGALLAFGVLLLVFNIMDKKADYQMIKNIRVAINLNNLALPVDPLKNTTLTNAFLTNHLYSGLIEETDDGTYVPDLCNSFEWFGEDFVCDFPDYSPVDAEDSKASLVRSILDEKNDHANLKHLLCGQDENEKNCLDRIYVKNKKLYIKVKEANKRPLLISLLASINLKIVPKSSISGNGPNSKITNYENTSGFYHIKDNDFLTLYATDRLLRKHPTAPKAIQLVDAKTSSIKELIEQDKIDVISSTVPMTEAIAGQLVKNKWSLFETYPISVGLVVFSDKAISRSTSLERFYVANKIITEINKLNLYKAKPTDEFIQFFGQGYLSELQKNSLLERKNQQTELKSTFTFGVSTPEKWQSLAEAIPNLKIVKSNQNIIAENVSDKPDIVLLTNDVSFDNNFSFFAFAVNHGLIGKSGSSKTTLISEFANQDNTQNRIKYINELHYRSLYEARIVPIFSSPYFTATKSDFNIKLSKYNSRTLLWKITQN